MRWKMFPEPPIHHILLWLIITLEIVNVQCAELKDILLNPKPDDENIRVPRDSKYSNRYGARTAPDTLNDRKIKPEESPESQTKDTIVGKRCIRCDSGYLDSRYPTNQRNRQYDDRYDYDDRRYDDRYDRYDYDDRYSRDRYDRPRDNNYYDRNRFDRDRYDRDRYRNPYDRDRYDRDRTYDRYDRDRYDDRYDRDRYGSDRRDRYNDRGIGYDNRGYDYRERYDRDGYRPQDETYRGTSGFDRNGRGYYFAGVGRPAESGNWAGGYASAWNYGGDRGKGYTDGYYRPRDDLYRGVSYLYGRPSEETTVKTNTTTEANETKQTQQGNSSG